MYTYTDTYIHAYMHYTYSMCIAKSDEASVGMFATTSVTAGPIRRAKRGEGRVLLIKIITVGSNRSIDNVFVSLNNNNTNNNNHNNTNSNNSNWEIRARKARIEIFEFDDGFQPYHPPSEERTSARDPRRWILGTPPTRVPNVWIGRNYSHLTLLVQCGLTCFMRMRCL